jgi:uncharacterized repeat protein (TIGR03803 family)
MAIGWKQSKTATRLLYSQRGNDFTKRSAPNCGFRLQRMVQANCCINRKLFWRWLPPGWEVKGPGNARCKSRDSTLFVNHRLNRGNRIPLQPVVHEQKSPSFGPRRLPLSNQLASSRSRIRIFLLHTVVEPERCKCFTYQNIRLFLTDLSRKIGYCAFMKATPLNPVLLPILLVAFGSMVTSQASAQTFTTLHSFNGQDGHETLGSGLVLTGTTLYGVTSYGGDYLSGNVFEVNTDGSGFGTLYSFTDALDTFPNNVATNNDGRGPNGHLVLANNILYGVTVQGGDSGQGTVFAINLDGTGFNTLHNFKNSDGVLATAGLVLSRDTLYGASQLGGSGSGTLFKLATDGTGFTVLHTFTGRNDGAGPEGDLAVLGNTLFGTASEGGSSGYGTVFKVNTDGTGFTVFYSFNGGSDGASPHAGLTLRSNTLYGTTYGTPSGAVPISFGTIFAIDINGTGFTTLHSFSGGDDGAYPADDLVICGDTLFGATLWGGSSGNGTVFKVKIDGTGFTTVHSFTIASDSNVNFDGFTPVGRLILSPSTLYGKTEWGGAYGYGTVFSISFTPEPTLTTVGANVILSWPTNYDGFDSTGFALYSTTNLAAPVWTSNSAPPTVINGQNTVTNPISGTQRFFRLAH